MKEKKERREGSCKRESGGVHCGRLRKRKSQSATRAGREKWRKRMKRDFSR